LGVGRRAAWGPHLLRPSVRVIGPDSDTAGMVGGAPWASRAARSTCLRPSVRSQYRPGDPQTAGVVSPLMAGNGGGPPPCRTARDGRSRPPRGRRDSRLPNPSGRSARRADRAAAGSPTRPGPLASPGRPPRRDRSRSHRRLLGLSLDRRGQRKRYRGADRTCRNEPGRHLLDPNLCWAWAEATCPLGSTEQARCQASPSQRS
jgi:hypothetical protein